MAAFNPLNYGTPVENKKGSFNPLSYGNLVEEESLTEKVGSTAALVPFTALSALKGATDIFTTPLKGTQFDSGKLISDAVEYWREKSPEGFDVPNFSVYSDGKFQLKEEPAVPIRDIAGATAETTGFVAGPLNVASKAAGLVTEVAAKSARPFYKSIAKGMVTGALVGEGDKEKTLENAALFGVFEGLIAAGGKFNAARKIAKDTKWRMANVKERGLMLQSIDDLIQKNPSMTEGEILKRWNSDWIKKDALRRRSVGETAKTTPGSKPFKPEDDMLQLAEEIKIPLKAEPKVKTKEIEFKSELPIEGREGEGFEVKPVKETKLKKAYPQGADYSVSKDQDVPVEYKPIGKKVSKKVAEKQGVVPFKMKSFADKAMITPADKNPGASYRVEPFKGGYVVQRKAVEPKKAQVKVITGGKETNLSVEDQRAKVNNLRDRIDTLMEKYPRLEDVYDGTDVPGIPEKIKVEMSKLSDMYDYESGKLGKIDSSLKVVKTPVEKLVEVSPVKAPVTKITEKSKIDQQTEIELTPKSVTKIKGTDVEYTGYQEGMPAEGKHKEIKGYHLFTAVSGPVKKATFTVYGEPTVKKVSEALKKKEWDFKRIQSIDKAGITKKPKGNKLSYEPAELYNEDSIRIGLPSKTTVLSAHPEILHFEGTPSKLMQLIIKKADLKAVGTIDEMFTELSNTGYEKLQFINIQDGQIYASSTPINLKIYKTTKSKTSKIAPKKQIPKIVEEPKPVKETPLGYTPEETYGKGDFIPKAFGENLETLNFIASEEALLNSLEADSIWEAKELLKEKGYKELQFIKRKTDTNGIDTFYSLGEPIDLSDVVIPIQLRAKPKVKKVAKVEKEKEIQLGGKLAKAEADISSTKRRLLEDSLGYNPTRTVLAELLQNSFDATRGVKDKAIEIKVKDGALTVIDHGTGMSPLVMEDDFLNLFKQGSKSEEDMGGFGLAKLPIMGWPDSFKVYTVWEDPKTGTKYLSRVSGTREQYMEDNVVNFEVSIAPKGSKTGTVATLKKADIATYSVKQIAEEMGNNLRGGQAIDVVKTSLSGKAEVTNIKAPEWADVASMYPKQTIELGSNKIEVKFVSTAAYGWQGSYDVKTQVYNKGLLLPDIPQYTALGKFKLSKKPNFTIEVNFLKTPAASDAKNYPFLVNRTRLTKDIESEITRKVNETLSNLEANISKETQADLIRVFDEALVMGGTKVIIPFKENDVVDKVEYTLNKYPTLFEDLGKIYSEFSDVLKNNTDIPAHTYAITTYKGVHGFRPKTGILSEDYIVTNPFSYLSGTYGANLATQHISNLSAATGLIDTLTHEAAHNNVSGHYADYVGEFHRIQRMLSHKLLSSLEELANDFFKKHGQDIDTITGDLDAIQKTGTVSQIFSDYTPDEQRVEGPALDVERQTNEQRSSRAGSAGKSIIGDVNKILQRSDLEKLRGLGWTWKQAGLEQSDIGVNPNKMWRIIEPTPGIKRPVILVPPSGSKGPVLYSGLDPVAAAAMITKTASEVWSGSKPLRKNLGLASKAFQELILDPRRIMSRDPIAKQVFEALSDAEDAGNAFIYRNYGAYEKATKNIEPGSISDSRVGKALDGQITADKLTKNEKKAYDFFKENYEAMITEYARRAAGSEEAYKRILHAVASKVPKKSKIKDLSFEDKKLYDAIKSEAADLRRGRKTKDLSPEEYRKHESIKQQARDFLNKDYVKSLPANEAEAYNILSRKINDYLPHLFDKKELLDIFKKELDSTKAKLKKSTNKIAITGYKNRVNELEAAISNMEGGRLVTYDQLPSSVFFRFFNPRKGKKGYSFSAMKAYEAYLFGLARKMFDEPAVKLIKKNLYDNMPQNMKPYTKALVEHYMGRDKTPFDWLAGAITSFQWIRTLGLNPRSALVNFTQRLNTVAYAGEKYSALSEVMMLTDRKKANALFDKSGVAREVPNVLTEGEMPEGMEKVRSIVGVFFNTVELGNRKHAYLAGYLKAKSKGASDANAMKAGIKTVHKTQFRYGKLGMPKMFWNPAARVAFQFSSYTLKQAQFIYDLGEFDKLLGKKKGDWTKETDYTKVTGEHRAAGLLRLMKWIAYTTGINYTLREFLDTDMSNAMGIGITWGEALNVITSLAKGDTKAAWRHAKLSYQPGAGIFPQGLGPTASGMLEVGKAVGKDKGLEQLGKELTPVMVSRLLQAYKAVKSKRKSDKLYTVHGTTGNAIYKLSKKQLLQRTLGPKTAVEGKTSREYDIAQGFKLERASGMKDVIDALVSGDKKALTKAVNNNKEAVAVALRTKGLLTRMVKARVLAREFTRAERQKPNANFIFRTLREGQEKSASPTD